MKIAKKLMALFLIIALCIPILNELPVMVAEAAGEEYALYVAPVGSTTADKDIEITSSGYLFNGSETEMLIRLRNKKDHSIPAGATVHWDVKTSLPASSIVIDGPNDQLEVKVKRTHPGRSTLTATFEIGGVIYPLDATITVPFAVEKNPNVANSNFTYIDTEGQGGKNFSAMVFYPTEADNAAQKDLSLMYRMESTPDSVEWQAENPPIADVAQESAAVKAHVKAYSAGISLITGNAYSQADVKDSFYAVVMPKFGANAANLHREGNELKLSITGGPTSPVNDLSEETPRKIYTNALDTTALKWQVKTRSDDKDVFSVDASKYLKYELDKNLCNITSAKAGTYELTALPTSQNVQINEKTLPPTKMSITVPLNLNPEYTKTTEADGSKKKDVKITKQMGVGDIFGILNNFNFQEKSHFEVTNVTDPNVIKYNAAAGTIEAVGKGEAEVTIKLNPEKKGLKKLYALDDLRDSDISCTIKFDITDGLSLSESDITMSIGEVRTLTAISTNNLTVKEWSVDDPSTVSVTKTSSNTAEIKALKKGTTTVYVTQLINGITKKAKCIVRVVEAIDKITIKPEGDINLSIEEEKVLKAEYNPADISVTDFHWITTDESIVSLNQTTGNSVTITGKKGGTATIMVINKDNIVYDSRKVFVNEDITGIKIDPTVTVPFSQKTYQLKAEVEPDTATNKGLTWKTNKTDVATVDEKGLLTFLKPGEVTVIVASKNNPSVMAMCNITITASVEDFKLEADEKVMYVGEESALKYTFTPSNANNQNIKWKSTKTSVATVDANGMVKAVANGETTIIAQSEDGNIVRTCNIQVKSKAKSITITAKDVTLNKGDKYKIEYTINPNLATEIELSWTSTKPSVATIDQNGEVTAVAEGSTIITARLSNGEVAYCNVTVEEITNGVVLNYKSKTIYQNNTFTLQATIVPSGATNKKVTWESSDTSVATVDSKGKVKGIKPGYAIITCTTAAGGYQQRCIVTVKKMVTKLTLNRTSYILGVKSKVKLTAKVTSTNATNKKVKWTSSNSSVAYVDTSGLVTGRKKGTAVITAATTDGSDMKAKCTIKVVQGTTKIKLNRTLVTMVNGRTMKLTATITPKNATYKTVNWKSSNSKVVKVLANGTILALQPGTATITASSKDNNGAKKASCYVTVKEQVSASGVSILTKNPVLVAGESLVLHKSITPANSTDRAFWSSDNSVVASVDRTTGKVKSKAPGVANITLISDSGKSDSTTVSVIGLNRTSLSLPQYTDYTLSVENAPGTVVWDVGDPSIATVTNGKVTSRKVGTTYVYATVRGRRLSCRLTVTSIR